MDLKIVTAVEPMYKKIEQIIDGKMSTMNAVKDKIMEMNVPPLYKGPLAFIERRTSTLKKYTEAFCAAYAAVISLSPEILCDDYRPSELQKPDSRVKDHVLNQDIPEMAQEKANLYHEAMVKFNTYLKIFNTGIISFPFAKSKRDQHTRILYTRIETDLINKLQKGSDHDYRRRKALIEIVECAKEKKVEISSRPRSSIPEERDHNRKKTMNRAEKRMTVETDSKRPRSSIPKEKDHNRKEALIRTEEQTKVVRDEISSKRPRSSIPKEMDHNCKRALIRTEEQVNGVTDETSSKRPRSSIPKEMDHNRKRALIRTEEQVKGVTDETSSKRPRSSIPEATTESCNRRFTEHKREQNNNHWDNGRFGRQWRQTVRCYICHRFGHYTNKCWYRKDRESFMHYWIRGNPRLYYQTERPRINNERDDRQR